MGQQTLMPVGLVRFAVIFMLSAVLWLPLVCQQRRPFYLLGVTSKPSVIRIAALGSSKLPANQLPVLQLAYKSPSLLLLMR